MKASSFLSVVIASLVSHLATAQTIIPMHLTTAKEPGKYIGTITATDTPKGLKLTPQLIDLPPGNHGFHIHVLPHCEDAGNAAGGHLDRAKTDQHLGPYRLGHNGDLPVLSVAANGKATEAVIAPRLKEADIQGHSLMIHAGGDNYSDYPEKLGGGGARIACGITPTGEKQK